MTLAGCWCWRRGLVRYPANAYIFVGYGDFLSFAMSAESEEVVSSSEEEPVSSEPSESESEEEVVSTQSVPNMPSNTGPTQIIALRAACAEHGDVVIDVEGGPVRAFSWILSRYSDMFATMLKSGETNISLPAKYTRATIERYLDHVCGLPVTDVDYRVNLAELCDFAMTDVIIHTDDEDLLDTLLAMNSRYIHLTTNNMEYLTRARITNTSDCFGELFVRSVVVNRLCHKEFSYMTLCDKLDDPIVVRAVWCLIGNDILMWRL